MSKSAKECESLMRRKPVTSLDYVYNTLIDGTFAIVKVNQEFWIRVSSEMHLSHEYIEVTVIVKVSHCETVRVKEPFLQHIYFIFWPFKPCQSAEQVRPR